MYDLIIKNGLLIDGTGNGGVYKDIAVKDGKIDLIKEQILSMAKEVIDAKGLVITPGFIDSHSHADNAMLEFSDLKEKVEQGITTSICGQCGASPAPVAKDITDENAKEIEGFGKANKIYKTFGSMVKIMENLPLGSNVKCFVGHKALRTAVIGYENRKPTRDEMEKMKALLREAMENGAIGLSFGLIYTPGCYAETVELIELAKVVKEYDGMLSAHIRDEGFGLLEAVEEFLTVIKEAKVRAVFSHHKSMYKKNWGKVQLSLNMIKDAINEGCDIYCDVYPYTASHTGLISTIIPKSMRDMNSAGICKMLKDSANRKKIKEEYLNQYGEDCSELQITICAGHPEFEGKKLKEVADMLNKDVWEASFDTIIDANGQISVCNFSMCEEDVKTVLSFNRAMLCTDSSVAKNNNVYHPRLRASFPRFLAEYVRKQGVMELGEAIRKITSLPAFVYGLKNKGLLKEGYDADICIFDKDKIKDNSTFADCQKGADGLNFVIVNGKVVCENAVYNGIRNGKFIKKDEN